MTIIKVGSDEYDIDGVVFDKDGLLFESMHFWKGLAEIRISHLKRIKGFPIEKWSELFGVHMEEGRVIDINPKGIFAIAAPHEEVTITASLIHEATGNEWGLCRNLSDTAFRSSDEEFDVRKVLFPKPGFPDIFRRLREAGIPYGIATSDDAERTQISIDVYDRADALSFIITPVHVKKGKPSPDMLHLASDIMGIPTSRLLMLGDSYVDVQMAHEAGSIGIGIPDDDEMRAKMVPYASKIIASLEELEF